METTDFSLSGGTVRWGCRGERLFLLLVYLREGEVKSRTTMCPSLGVSIRFQAFGCLPAEQWYVCMCVYLSSWQVLGHSGGHGLRATLLEQRGCAGGVALCWLL